MIDWNSSKFDDFEVIASNGKFPLLVEILLTEVTKEEEAEKHLYSTEGVIIDTISRWRSHYHFSTRNRFTRYFRESRSSSKNTILFVTRY